MNDTMRPSLFQILRKKIWDDQRDQFRNKFPFRDYQDQRQETKFVDLLGDADLTELNKLLRWNCFTVDGHGRRFGNAAWEGKRSEPHVIPDRRILLMNERFDLSDKHVLEVGCFEGIHTIGLSMYAKKVTAIDARIENVVKTIVRCALFGYHPTVFKCNLEERPLNTELLRAEVACHIGVLYHLKDPVRQLFDLSDLIQRGLLLDTHYALDEEAIDTYEVHGRTVRYKKYHEAGYSDPFSGVYDHSKWLTLDDIIEMLRASGFGKTDIVETRRERNGPRVLIVAERG